ncbi:MAG: rod shape determining protein RodA [Candidatus Atribacteria bacterium]|nr:rod shape determining protein RodA [Candidatus Atribacteria bacterium]
MDFKKPLVIAALVLSILGIFAVYSVDPFRGQGLVWSSFYGRQIIWCLVSWVWFLLIIRIDYQTLIKYGWWIYLLVIFSLIAVLIVGEVDETGSRRWIFSRSVQPSELAKIGFIIFLTRYLVQRVEEFDTWALFFKVAALGAIPTLLIFFQPDFGTAIFFVIISFLALVLSNFAVRRLLVILGMGVVASFISWFFLLDYQKERLLSFFAPQRDPLGSGYNVIQSLIAIGAGGLSGKGWLSGSQSQLQFLPARYTDFIFAAWCEQFGFLGGMALLVLFGVLIWSMFNIALECPNLEGKFLTSLLTWIFVFQIGINIGMNMGIMPVTGIPLPFISYGGSSLVVNLTAVGIIYNVAQSKGEEDWEPIL